MMELEIEWECYGPMVSFVIYTDETMRDAEFPGGVDWCNLALAIAEAYPQFMELAIQEHLTWCEAVDPTGGMACAACDAGVPCSKHPRNS